MALSVLLCSSAIAQVSIPIPSQTEINNLLKGKTYVVLENALFSDYNDIITATVEKHWSLNSFEFIKISDFEAKRKETNASFLMINQVSFYADKTKTKFDFLVLIAGGKYKSVNEMPLLCMVPMCYDGVDEAIWTNKIPIAVKFIQKHINTVKSNSKINSKNVVDFYLQNAENISGKTLYLTKNQVEPSLKSESNFKKIYPYSFKFVSDEDLNKILEAEDENALILHIVSPTKNTQANKCIKMIVNPHTAQIYYYDMHNIGKNKPAKLLEKDLKKLIK